MLEEKMKHLGFIQDIIARMNTNSFQIKQWTVTLVSALIAIYVSTKNDYFVLAALLPVAVFCFLDSYYLMQERKFRGLYDDVAEITDSPKAIKSFEMRPDIYKGGKYSYMSSVFSKTILSFYLSIAIGLIGLFASLKYL